MVIVRLSTGQPLRRAWDWPDDRRLPQELDELLPQRRREQLSERFQQQVRCQLRARIASGPWPCSAAEVRPVVTQPGNGAIVGTPHRAEHRPAGNAAASWHLYLLVIRPGIEQRLDGGFQHVREAEHFADRQSASAALSGGRDLLPPSEPERLHTGRYGPLAQLAASAGRRDVVSHDLVVSTHAAKLHDERVNDKYPA